MSITVTAMWRITASSLAVLAILAIWLIWSVREVKRSDIFRTSYLFRFVAVVAACVFALTWAWYRQDMNITDALLATTLRTMQFFTMEGGFDELEFAEYTSFFQHLFHYEICLLQIVAPILTLTTILSLFRRSLLMLYFRIRKTRPVFIFSNLSDDALMIAQDIAAKSKGEKPFLVFCREDGEADDDDEDAARILAARELRAIFYEGKIDSFKPGNDRKTSYFLLDEREKENMLSLIRLTEALRSSGEKRAHLPHIYVFSMSDAAAEIVDKRIDTEGKIYYLHLFNLAKVAAQNLMFEHPLYNVAGDQDINVILVGEGEYGMELLKACVGTGVLHTRKCTVTVLDRTAGEMEKRCHHLFPALFAEEDGKKLYPGNLVNVRFIACDPSDDSFDEALASVPDANYVILQSGDDREGFDTALFIYRWYIRRAVEKNLKAYVAPSLFVQMDDESWADALREITSPECHIHFFGQKQQMLTLENITGRFIDRLAGAFDYIYSRNTLHDPYFTEKRMADIDSAIGGRLARGQLVNQYSSQMSALHSFYKLYDAVGEDVRTWKSLTDDQILEKCRHAAQRLIEVTDQNEEMGRLEHDRWAVAQSLAGFAYYNLDDLAFYRKTARAESVPSFINPASQKVPEANMHACITEYDNLARLGAMVGKDFYSYDLQNCYMSLFALRMYLDVNGHLSDDLNSRLSHVFETLANDLDNRRGDWEKQADDWKKALQS